jgi:hypothetical protein
MFTCLKFKKSKIKKFPEKGDFSWMRNVYKYELFMLEYDYKAIFSSKKFVLLLINNNLRKSFELNMDDYNPWNTPPGEEWEEWEELSRSMCQAHNEQTYIKNIQILTFIAKNGWKKFVELNR